MQMRCEKAKKIALHRIAKITYKKDQLIAFCNRIHIAHLLEAAVACYSFSLLRYCDDFVRQEYSPLQRHYKR